MRTEGENQHPDSACSAISQQSADAFSDKMARIQRQGETRQGSGMRRTPISEDEVNSWFVHRAQPVLPRGVAQPQLTIVGQGRLSGQAVVDLEAIGRRRSSGGLFDPWSLLGGRVPVAVTGVLHTRDGMGQFQVEEARLAGIPMPAGMLQDLLVYYSRSPERPQGVRLDDPFTLPASIRQIEIGPGQAVVVQ
jgi:hypothetical protein